MATQSHIVFIGALAGSIPTISMIFTSLFAKEVELSASFQATAQNLCAGLILGAVAKELFPALYAPSFEDNLVGVSVGFFAGLFFVNFLDYVVEWAEGVLAAITTKEPSGSGESASLNSANQLSYQSIDENDLNDLVESAADTDARPILELATQSMQSEAHREKIRLKMKELLESIDIIQSKSELLIAHKTPESTEAPIARRPSWQLLNNEEEKHADQIDEQIHRLQYNLDHCRRLVQGCESNIIGVVPRLWITEAGKASLIAGLEHLKSGARALVCFLKEDNPSTQSLIDIHSTMSEMDKYISELHDTVEEYSFKWGRRGHRGAIGLVPAGSTIPLSLMFPVTVDCIVDGFLVGTTCSISVRAGFILAMANCIEMGFLGLAVSMRVKQCTASSVFARYTALIMPPIIMLLASVLGSFVGSTARSYPMLYIGFISFGVVALLYLVVNELLVEARESLTGNEQWWSGMVLFMGVYFVLLLDLLIK